VLINQAKRRKFSLVLCFAFGALILQNTLSNKWKCFLKSLSSLLCLSILREEAAGLKSQVESMGEEILCKRLFRKDPLYKERVVRAFV